MAEKELPLVQLEQQDKPLTLDEMLSRITKYGDVQISTHMAELRTVYEAEFRPFEFRPFKDAIFRQRPGYDGVIRIWGNPAYSITESVANLYAVFNTHTKEPI